MTLVRGTKTSAFWTVGPSAFVLYIFLGAFILSVPIADAKSVVKDNLYSSRPKDELGAVASENAICTRHGTRMLEIGGNAADAMVATLLCVGVVGTYSARATRSSDKQVDTAMYHSGLGGGGFLVVRSPNGSYEAVDFRETAPAGASHDMYQAGAKAADLGGLASGVPGELRGIEYLHEKYGSLSWSTVFQDAIELARDGFPVTEDLANYITAATEPSENPISPDLSLVFDGFSRGRALNVGDVVTRSRYAATLQNISENGADVFYDGLIAQATVAAVKHAKGIMTLDDLRSYTIQVRNVSQVVYRGHCITSSWAPSSGPIVLSVLKMLEPYNDLFSPSNVNLTVHRIVEAMKFGFGERAGLGDPAFVDGMDAYVADILSNSTTMKMHRKIRDDYVQAPQIYSPLGSTASESLGTSHISTTDRSGLTISLTTTINDSFGSRVIVPETGVIMNDVMNCFEISSSADRSNNSASGPNSIHPGKRPLSAMSPVVVTRPDGNVELVTGAGGSSRIITATVQNIIHIIDQRLSAEQALQRPRLHHQLLPDQLSLEYAWDNGTVSFLKSRGHNVTWVPGFLSMAQAIQVSPDGAFDAAGDPRQSDSAGAVV